MSICTLCSQLADTSVVFTASSLGDKDKSPPCEQTKITRFFKKARKPNPLLVHERAQKLEMGNEAV